MQRTQEYFKMNFLIDYLRKIGGQKGRVLFQQMFVTVLIAWIPSQLIWLLMSRVFPGPEEENYFKTPLTAITMALLLAPILETQMMRFMFFGLGKVIKSELMLCSVCSVAWGIQHLASVSWGMHAVWAFFIMGICYLRLQQHSTQHAIRVTTVIHAGFNTLSYALYHLLKSI